MPENREEIEPVAVGQREIEHDEVRGDRLSVPDAGHAVGRDIDVIAFGSEIVLKHEPQRRIVFDDENAVAHQLATPMRAARRRAINMPGVR